jgi:hypothetical protein
MYTIAVILDETFGDKSLPITEEMPVWICESEINRKTISKFNYSNHSNLNKNEIGYTIFKLNKNENLEFNFINELEIIDRHHNEYSHKPAWEAMIIIGIKQTSKIELKLLEYGNGKIQIIENGFKFIKDKEIKS